MKAAAGKPGDHLDLRVRTASVKYGDGRTFIQYAVVFLRGAEVVGIEHGPRRHTERRVEAIRAARQRIAELRRHRLFAIEVTRQHISDGEARNCRTCAISQALWHNQERMGFARSEFDFEVSPYGAFADPRGIVVSPRYNSAAPPLQLPIEKAPELCFAECGKYAYSESLAEWAMRFDEWAESRYMPLKEWREKHGYEPGDRPYRPGPCSFVLDLDAFQVAQEGAR